MKENVDKYLDSLTKKVIKEGVIETPSFNFTDDVMSQVKKLNTNQATLYKPLIPKTTWALILIGFSAVFIYVLWSGAETETSVWFIKINFDGSLTSKVNNALSSFKMSKTLMYAVVLLALMLSVQISFLKHHFNQRFSKID